MNKMLISLSIFAIFENCFGMDKDQIIITAKKLSDLNNNYITSYQKEKYLNTLHNPRANNVITLISFFDHSKSNDTLKKGLIKSVIPDNNGHYDFTSLESNLYKLMQENQTFFQRHRGKFGFGAGFLTGVTLVSIPLLYVLSCFPRFSK